MIGLRPESLQRRSVPSARCWQRYWQHSPRGRSVGRVVQNAKLKAQFAVARGDVAFLLAIEERHCELPRCYQGQSNKLRVREYVKQQTDRTWSGRHTPGRTA